MRRRWSSLACVEVGQDMGDDLNGADVLGGSIFGSEVQRLATNHILFIPPGKL